MDCDDIHAIYSAIVRDEICENFLTGVGWMYLMLLLISLFGMIIITLRNVVWLSLAAKITPSISSEERSSLIRLPSVGTDGAVVNDTAVVTDAVVPCRVNAPLGSGRSEFNATRNSPDCSVKRESSRTLQRKGNYIIKMKTERMFQKKNIYSNKKSERVLDIRYNTEKRNVDKTHDSDDRNRYGSVTTKDWDFEREISRESQVSNHSSNYRSVKTKDWDLNNENDRDGRSSKHNSKYGSVNTKDWDYTTTDKDNGRETMSTNHSSNHRSVETKDWDYSHKSDGQNRRESLTSKDSSKYRSVK